MICKKKYSVFLLENKGDKSAHPADKELHLTILNKKWQVKKAGGNLVSGNISTTGRERESMLKINSCLQLRSDWTFTTEDENNRRVSSGKFRFSVCPPGEANKKDRINIVTENGSGEQIFEIISISPNYLALGY